MNIWIVGVVSIKLSFHVLVAPLPGQAQLINNEYHFEKPRFYPAAIAIIKQI